MGDVVGDGGADDDALVGVGACFFDECEEVVGGGEGGVGDVGWDGFGGVAVPEVDGGAVFVGGLGECDCDFAAAAVGEDADVVDGFCGGSADDEEGCVVVGLGCEEAGDGGGDGRSVWGSCFGAVECWFEDVDACVAAGLDVVLDEGVSVHGAVHGGDEEDGDVGSECGGDAGGDGCVVDAVGDFGDGVGGAGGEEDEVDGVGDDAAELDVFDLAGELCDGGVSGGEFEGVGVDDVGGGGCHDGDDVGVVADEVSGDVDGVDGGDAAGDAEENAFAVEGCAEGAFDVFDGMHALHVCGVVCWFSGRRGRSGWRVVRLCR